MVVKHKGSVFWKLFAVNCVVSGAIHNITESLS
jgi:hypothetical protein